MTRLVTRWVSSITLTLTPPFGGVRRSGESAATEGEFLAGLRKQRQRCGKSGLKPLAVPYGAEGQVLTTGASRPNPYGNLAETTCKKPNHDASILANASCRGKARGKGIVERGVTC